YRIGIGYDVHRLEEGLQLFLGGVKVEHGKGLVGHSDADVLIHALCDALLGAAALGDIGAHFPDSDAAYKGIDSKVLLRKVVEMLAREGYRIENVDSVVAAQRPKLGPYIPAMRQALAETLSIPVERVSVKATTTERLGFEGREEGISAQAIALISKE
ncbi:MAG: 2-C-methyl-D-erythritol 2,4-cyclodiphosphate synthase, partial [Bacteroidales bacterium]|nr:2-C-methyl-D-erythritol 2,4-cyclodiphosphate synthase [Bacteroidales bacterium]